MSFTATPLGAPVRRAILGLGVSQIIGWGTTYYLLALLGEPIGRDLKLSSGLVLAGVSITLLLSAFLGPWVGRMQDQHGARPIMMAGSLVMAAGLAIVSQAQGVIGYYFCWLIIGIGTPMALYNAAFTALTQMAGQNARRAITLLTFMAGLASTIFWPFSAFLLQLMDWRGAVLIFADLNLFIALPVHGLVLKGGATASQAAGQAAPIAASVAPEAQAKAFLLLAAMLALNAFITNGWAQLVFPVLDDLGFSHGVAVTVASLGGVFQVAGRMGEMALGGRHSPFWTGFASMALMPLALVILLLAGGSFAGGLIFAVFYGVSNGLITIARGAMTLAVFGARGYGERLGKVTFAQSIIAGLAPVMGGVMLDGMGAARFILAFLVIAFLALFAMLLLMRHAWKNPARVA